MQLKTPKRCFCKTTFVANNRNQRKASHKHFAAVQRRRNRKWQQWCEHSSRARNKNKNTLYFCKCDSNNVWRRREHWQSTQQQHSPFIGAHLPPHACGATWSESKCWQQLHGYQFGTWLPLSSSIAANCMYACVLGWFLNVVGKVDIILVEGTIYKYWLVSN